MFLSGSVFHKLDTKGRLTLPAKWRRDLPANLVVVLSLTEDYLMVFTEEDYAEWFKALFKEYDEQGYDPADFDMEYERMNVNSRAMHIDIDSAGRLGIPKDQQEEVGLDKEVVLVGNGSFFAIWDAKRWEEQKARMRKTSRFARKAEQTQQEV